MWLNRTTVRVAAITETGVDAFHRPTTTKTWENVSGCVVGSPSSDDVTNEMNLTGKRIAYVILIPKGDAHNWENTEVEIGGEVFKTIGAPVRSFANLPNIPCDQRISVERYE